MATPTPSNSRVPEEVPRRNDWGFLKDDQLSWFCCYRCSRRPITDASFDILLTTCQHIVCSSCWDTSRGLSGECPCCGADALTLNLSTTRPFPKQLDPYFKSPEELLSSMLSACQFQQHQKQQFLARRKKAWVLINHAKAKEDYEKEYTACKKIHQQLNEKKETLRTIVEILHKKGIDPVQQLRGVFPDDLVERVFNSLGPLTRAPSTQPSTTTSSAVHDPHNNRPKPGPSDPQTPASPKITKSATPSKEMSSGGHKLVAQACKPGPSSRPSVSSGQVGTWHLALHHSPLYHQHWMNQYGQPICCARAALPSTPPQIYPSPAFSHTSQRSSNSKKTMTRTPPSKRQKRQDSPTYRLGPPPSILPLSRAVAVFHSFWSERSQSSPLAWTSAPPSPLLISFTAPAPWQQTSNGHHHGRQAMSPFQCQD